MEEDGRLEFRNGQPIAFIRADRPDERKRFSLCHELAHFVLATELAGRALTAQTLDAAVSEEYICDKVAGAMLMPPEWIMRFKNEPRVLATVRKVARAAGVSQSAALVRLRDVLRWDRSLLQWSRRQGRWSLDGESGMYPAQQGLVRTTEATRFFLTYAAAGKNVPGQKFPICFAGDELTLPAEIRVIGDRAIVLLKLPYPEQQFQARPSAWGRGRTRPTIRMSVPDRASFSK